MLRTTMLPTARNSDCQFCSVRFQKFAETKYWGIEIGASRFCSRSLLYALVPATSCAPQEPRKNRPMTRPSELEYRAVRQPPARAHLGEFLLACAPSFCCWSSSPPLSSTGLDSGDPRWTSQTVRTM